ncbi:hypothetical protein PGB90_002285 [Kerria lacca]
MSPKNEFACVYAAMILIDDDVTVTGEKIQTILKAANVEVEPYWPGLFAKSLEGINPKDLICNVGSSAGAGAPTAGTVAATPVAVAAPAVPEKKVEEKKKEESEESDDDMGFGKNLFFIFM